MKTLPRTINSKTDEALEEKLKNLSSEYCFNFMGKYLADETNKLLRDPNFQGGQVLVRICSASEVANIKAKEVSELGSTVDYGDDDPTRDFKGSKMYFFNLSKSLEDGKAGNDFIGALRDRTDRITQIHNARAQAGLERYEEFDNPSYAVVVLPKGVRAMYADKIATGTSAYNNKHGGSSMMDEIVFNPEVLKHCGVATCNDLYTELQSKMDNPYFYNDILENGSDILKKLVLNMLTQIENENSTKEMPKQAKANLEMLEGCLSSKGDFMACLTWFCSSGMEGYNSQFTTVDFLNKVCETYGSQMEALKISEKELTDLREVAKLNDSKNTNEVVSGSEDALDYSDDYADDDYESDDDCESDDDYENDDDWGSDSF